MNLNESEKSRGVLLFAFNSKTVDYVKIADLSSRLIEKNLGLPVTLVTDVDAAPAYDYDHIIRVESKTGNIRLDNQHQVYEWKNFDRYLAYQLSPYQETILIDSDYLMLDNSLLTLFEQPFDYRLQYNMRTIDGVNNDLMGPLSLPLIWATVVLFRKTEHSKNFFDLVGRIQRNYGYYKTLFSVTGPGYRNDYAFSMANIILNGYRINKEESIPWHMITIEKDIQDIEIKNQFLVVRNSDQAQVISKQNLHVMDKKFLTSEKFETFVGDICRG